VVVGASALADLPVAGVRAVRLTAVLLAAAAAGCLDDSCDALTVTTPVGRARQRRVTLALTAAAVLAGWSAMLVAVVATSPQPLGGSGAVVGLVAEVVALGAVAVLLATALARSGQGWAAGASGGLALVVGLVLSREVPRLGWLWLQPNEAHWRAAHAGWSSIGIVALAAVSCLARDPAGPLALRRARPSSGPVRP
jgi:hypothetical protein